MNKPKEIYSIVSPREEHWVGDGFFVSSIFSTYTEEYKHISPFLLMDHAAPKYFPPTQRKLGVGEHPHRGFETVTIAIKGEIDHKDSGGGGGRITTGGVQWMTAASGLVHEEFHSRKFAEEGGELEMVQLWVNLPAKYKMTAPHYQSRDEGDFPKIDLANGGIKAKIIAGGLFNEKSSIKTFTPINIYELNASKVSEIELSLMQGTNTLVFQLAGKTKLNESSMNPRDLAILKREGDLVHLKMEAGSKLLVLNGEPIDEPLATYGPFVMNTQSELQEAFQDFHAGKMGRLVEEESVNV